MVLHGDEAGPAVPLGDVEHLGELPGVHRRGADIAGLARSHHVVEGFDRLLHRGAVVKTVDLVEVDVVHAQPAQAVVDLGKHGLAGQAGAVGAGVHAAVDLGRQHDLVPLGVARPRTLPTISSLLPSE